MATDNILPEAATGHHWSVHAETVLPQLRDALQSCFILPKTRVPVRKADQMKRYVPDVRHRVMGVSNLCNEPPLLG